MNVLVIPQAYPTKRKKHLTPFIKENSVQLARLGYTVSIFNVEMLPLKEWVNDSKDKIDKYNDENVVVYHITMKYFKGMNKLNTNVFMKKINILYQLYLKNNKKPDIIISHFSQIAGYCAAQLSKMEKIPHVSIEHAGWLLSNDISNYELKKLLYTYHFSEKMICVSKLLKESIANKLKNDDNLCVIPNMISDDYNFHDRIKKEKFVFFSAGNLYPGKKFDFLIDAFCDTFNSNENVELRIAGVGKQLNKLERLIKNRNRNYQIKLLGPLNKEMMKNEYIYCDCFVLVSDHETFGIVYREAMASGRPIITTNHQGFHGELWNNEFGIKVNINNKNELKKALKDMRNHIDNYNLLKISRICRNNYSTNMVINEYDKLIKKIIFEKKEIE